MKLSNFFQTISLIIVAGISLPSINAQVNPITYCGGMQCWPKVYLPSGTLECGSYNISLNDNFNDLSNWHTYRDHGGAPNIVNYEGEEQFYLEDNVEIANNKCILHGKYAPNTIMTNPSDNGVYNRDFTSGMIECNKDFHFGYYEATVEDMPGGGWWPAFWMNNHVELDIMERFASDDTYRYSSISAGSCDVANEYKIPQVWSLFPSLFEGPHTFAAEWTPFKITFYYNGIELPYKVYRYYDFDGKPKDINCGDSFNAGLYYENPGFMPPLHSIASPIEAAAFHPILNLAVLPRFGLQCKGPNNPNCDIFGCSPNVCGDTWGNPFRQDSTREINTELNTEMVISNVTVKERTYKVCNSIFVKYDPVICEPTSTIEVGILGNLQGWPTHHVKIVNVTTSTNLTATFQHNEPHVISNLITLTVNSNSPGGLGFFEISYKDECTNAINIIKREVKINLPTEACPIVGCSSSAVDYECCPPGTTYDGYNCFYGKVPIGYQPFIYQNSFYVVPNNTISTNNHGCPIGYDWDTQNCHSGFNYPDEFTGFIYDNGFYVRPKCNDIRDCCPPGPYTFDGLDCYSGVSIPLGYQGFIWHNNFYVKPNCQIPTTNTHCCPEGYTFDGANCYSGVWFPEGFTAVIYENEFHVLPNCEWWETPLIEEGLDRSQNDSIGFKPVVGDSSFTFEIWPNPIFSNNLVAKISGIDLSDGMLLQIYNVNGVMQSEFQLKGISENEPASISISDFSNGLYFLRIRSNSQVLTKMFVISR